MNEIPEGVKLFIEFLTYKKQFILVSAPKIISLRTKTIFVNILIKIYKRMNLSFIRNDTGEIGNVFFLNYCSILAVRILWHCRVCVFIKIFSIIFSLLSVTSTTLYVKRGISMGQIGTLHSKGSSGTPISIGDRFDLIKNWCLWLRYVWN